MPRIIFFSILACILLSNEASSNGLNPPAPASTEVEVACKTNLKILRIYNAELSSDDNLLSFKEGGKIEKISLQQIDRMQIEPPTGKSDWAPVKATLRNGVKRNFQYLRVREHGDPVEILGSVPDPALQRDVEIAHCEHIEIKLPPWADLNGAAPPPKPAFGK